MKPWLKGVLGLLVLLLVVLLIVMVRGGTLIRQGVNQAGPQLLGVPVKVDDVTFRPLRGLVQLKGLHVGNPKGYKTDGVFDLGLVEIRLKSSSLLSDTIVIESVKIEKPVITYERGLKNSNLGALLEQLEGEKKAEGEERKEEPKAESGTGGRKVIIRDLQVNGAQVKVSLTALQGLAAPIPLPPVHVEGIGEESGGASFGEALGKIIGAVLGAVTEVVTGAGKLVGEGVSAAGEAAADGVKAVGEAAGKLTEGMGNLIKGK